MKLKSSFSRTVFCGCLLFSLCLGLPSTSMAADKTYQVTETELSRLETNLNRLQTIAKESKNESEQQKEQLIVLKSQLSEADNLLVKQQASLQNANNLLEQYEDEQKKIRERTKRERMVCLSVIGVLLVHQIAK